MKRTLSLTLLAVTILFAGVNPSQSQALRRCLPHGDIVKQLQDKYGEQVIGLGLAGEGRQVIEVLVSEAGTWTVLVTQTNGLSCIASAGDNWTETAPINLAERGT